MSAVGSSLALSLASTHQEIWRKGVAAEQPCTAPDWQSSVPGVMFLPGDSSSCHRVPDSRSVIVETRTSAGVRWLRRAVEEPGVRVAWRALCMSRVVVFLSGVFAVLAFGRAAGTAGFDPSGVTA